LLKDILGGDVVSNLTKFPVVYIEHTSDIGIRASGKTLEEALENLGYGVVNLWLEDGGELIEEREIEINADTKEDLVVAFVNELIYLLEGERFLTLKCKVLKLTDNHLKVSLKGERFSPEKHKLAIQIKACTYHNLKVEQNEDDCLIEVILDV